MQVINNPNTGDALGAKPLDDGDLILRFAEPSAVIVERHRATDFADRFRNYPNALCLSGDAGLLLLGVARWLAAAGDPKLGGQSMPFEHVEDEPGLIVERRRKPPRQQTNAMPF